MVRISASGQPEICLSGNPAEGIELKNVCTMASWFNICTGKLFLHYYQVTTFNSNYSLYINTYSNNAKYL